MRDDAQAHLRDLAAQHDLLIGTAVSTGPFGGADPTYREVLAREFNILVAENMMKFGELSPAEGEYDWAATDALVEFAEANGMQLRGHTLVWHHQLPRWIANRSWTAAEVRALLEQHVKAVVGRYRGRIAAWDVVNEAIADGGGQRADSFWYRHLGPDYIAMAFHWAHEADPGATLYYNDYDAEDLAPKSDAVYGLVAELARANVPLHGVGWQMHLAEGWRLTPEHRRNAERLRELGLELSITELDVRLPTPASAAHLQSQAESYRDVIEFAREWCAAVLTWGFTDKYSWIPGFRPGFGAALPLDAEYRPKPAYLAMREALLPATRTRGGGDA